MIPSLRELTRLYEYIGDMAELAYTARRWKEVDEKQCRGTPDTLPGNWSRNGSTTMLSPNFMN